eukprot:669429-Rhodomonas_salina.1
MEHSKLTGGRKQIGIKSLGLNQWFSQEVLDVLILAMGEKPGVSTGKVSRATSTHTHVFTSNQWERIRKGGAQQRAMQQLKDQGVELVIIPVHWRGRKWLPTVWITETNHVTVIRQGHNCGDDTTTLEELSDTFKEATIDVRRVPDDFNTVNMTPLMLRMIGEWMEDPTRLQRRAAWMTELHTETVFNRASCIKTVRLRWRWRYAKPLPPQPPAPQQVTVLITSWNIGGKGVKRAERELRELGTTYAIILLQELRTLSKAKRDLKQWLKMVMPEYDAYVSQGGGKLSPQGGGVVTLVHRQLRAYTTLDREHKVKGRMLA